MGGHEETADMLGTCTTMNRRQQVAGGEVLYSIWKFYIIIHSFNNFLNQPVSTWIFKKSNTHTHTKGLK